MNLTQWAIKWGVPFEGVEDLRRGLGIRPDESDDDAAGAAESVVQSRIRVEASRKGARLWRNNVGALQDERGRWVRYGLCNESPAMNRQLKSADLVGIAPTLIEPQHVGHVFGRFIAREVKAADWRYTGTDRERAQLAFLELVLSLGGDAAFATGAGTIPALIDTQGNGG